MSRENQGRRAPLPGRRLAWLLILLTTLLTGCGDKDPFVELLNQGARVEFHDRDRRENVLTIRFPSETTDETLQILKTNRFAKVTNVDLSNTQIHDKGLKFLADLTSITSLDLNNTAVTDAGLEHLKKLTNLSNLDLGDTQVTDAGLEKLSAFKKLQTVSLMGKPKPKQPKERSWFTAIRLGIDLAGGTNLVYQVVEDKDDPESAKIDDASMGQVVSAVKRRLDPSGTGDTTVRRVGRDRIEVIIPRADPEVVAEKKRMMTKLGSLEFALLANEQDHADLIRRSKALPKGVRDVREEGTGRIEASWREVGLKQDGTPKKVSANYGVAIRDSRRNPDIKEFLVVFGPKDKRVLGKYLSRAAKDLDENAKPAVRFDFKSRYAYLFGELTGDNLPVSKQGFHRRLAVLLDGKVHSAPSIITKIKGNGQITGDFTNAEVEELVNVLNAGALVLPFKVDEKTSKPTPISEQTISPLLGSDVQEKGKLAIIIAASVVVGFMLLYYLFAGAVADFCLLLNLILVMGAMAFIDAAFTLPGMAGIVLTIGMAVDANVLIFERIREELNRGSSLRMAIQNGFSRAFTTIVDANLTTLITAVVLYMIGTDQVKGFAVTLFIGIVMSMFSALYVGRLVFDIWERKQWLKRLKMNSVIGATQWNFVSKKALAGTISALLIIAGIGGVVSRGVDLLDIDFTGGTMVTFEFKKSHPIEEVRDILQKDASAFGTAAKGKRPTNLLADGFTLETLKLSNEKGSDENGQRFRIRCKDQDQKAVKQEIANRCEAAGKGQYALRQVRIVKFDKAMIKKLGKSTVKKDLPGGFDDGLKVELQFTDDGLALVTFRDYVVRRLEDLDISGPDEFLHVEGLTKSSAKPTAGEAQKYQSIMLYAKKEIDRADLVTSLKKVETELAESPIFPEVNNFHSAVASDMQLSAVLAMVFSLLAIVIYIWFRFHRATFGIAAVVALVHDVTIVLGIVALAPYLGLGDFKLNLPMIAAFLTIVGYSLNDTIVVFDRIREVRGKNPALTDDIVNTSLNQTLSRTILTSLTTFFVVAILFAIGGKGIHGFAFCLVLGVVVGTYSSIYVASPVLLWLMNRQKRTSDSTSVKNAKLSSAAGR